MQSSKNHSQDKAGLFEGKKHPCYIQLNQKNFQNYIQALVILLQVGVIDSNGTKVTFHGCFEGLKVNQV